MVSAVIALSGAIGSGKTTLASELSVRIDHSGVRAFGDVVRDEAVRRGRSVDRDDLQKTGSELVAEGWDRFVGLLLDPPPTADVLVVEGVRHMGAMAGLGNHLPDARLFLVFVQPPAEVVEGRVVERGENVAALGHAVEAELPEVSKRADLVVAGMDVSQDAERVLSLLRSI